MGKLLWAALALLVLAGCQTTSESPARHECVVTPHDLVECNPADASA